jgi:hypothetical protein
VERKRVRAAGFVHMHEASGVTSGVPHLSLCEILLPSASQVSPRLGFQLPLDLEFLVTRSYCRYVNDDKVITMSLSLTPKSPTPLACGVAFQILNLFDSYVHSLKLIKVWCLVCTTIPSKNTDISNGGRGTHCNLEAFEVHNANSQRPHILDHSIPGKYQRMGFMSHLPRCT